MGISTAVLENLFKRFAYNALADKEDEFRAFVHKELERIDIPYVEDDIEKPLDTLIEEGLVKAYHEGLQLLK